MSRQVGRLSREHVQRRWGVDTGPPTLNFEMEQTSTNNNHHHQPTVFMLHPYRQVLPVVHTGIQYSRVLVRASHMLEDRMK